jgi:2,4-didehydro-3-deoxy-L-rhamnonate hydrolase
MKLYTFQHLTGPRPAIVFDDVLSVDLTAAYPDLPGQWPGLFPRLEEITGRMDDLRQSGVTGKEDFLFPTASRPWLPPILRPSKIIAVGLNYRDHAEEQNKTPPPRPMFFSKASTCLQAHNGPILLDRELQQVDAEAELAVVIAKAGRRIPATAAAEYILGYTCFNDVSDREAQYADKQFFRGKSIDTGGPCGPWIVTADELPPLAHGLKITGSVNGEIMQQSNTDQLIFPIDALIEHASRHMTLLPGDIIATGTPAGVGVFRDPPRFLKAGCVTDVEIEGIGTLTNPVISA